MINHTDTLGKNIKHALILWISISVRPKAASTAYFTDTVIYKIQFCLWKLSAANITSVSAGKRSCPILLLYQKSQQLLSKVNWVCVNINFHRRCACVVLSLHIGLEWQNLHIITKQKRLLILMPETRGKHCLTTG